LTDSRFGEVIIWDTESRDPLHVFKGVWRSQNCAEWSPEGFKLATWSLHGKEVAVRDGESGQMLRKFKMPENVIQVHWSPDATMLAIPFCCSTEGVLIWEALTGEQVSVLSCDARSVAWSSKPTTIAIVSETDAESDFREDWTVSLWDVHTGVKLHGLPGEAFAFSPDGNAVVTALEDGVLIVWDTQSGEELRRLTGHEGFVYSLGWSGDGDTIVCGRRGLITAWDSQTGFLIKTIDGSEIAGHN
jgi:WD40 repeat protein